MDGKSFLFGLVFMCGMLLIEAPEASGQSKVWVYSEGARLQADKSASSSSLADLPIGTELTVLSIQTPWYEVSTSSGKRGWIYRGKVSTSPPQGQKEGGGSIFSSLPGSGIQAQRADTSRSIRGLSPEASAYAERTKKPAKYQKALDEILAMNVRRSDVEGFLREGRIGEYAH